jgi:hypothetical protein
MTRGTKCGDDRVVFMNRIGSRVYVWRYLICSLEREGLNIIDGRNLTDERWSLSDNTSS